MGEVFTTLDLVIFFTALIGVMAVGLIAGRTEKTAEDYFLAGKGVPWWGVAGAAHRSDHPPSLLVCLLREDRFWAGILCAVAVFMHYYFY